MRYLCFALLAVAPCSADIILQATCSDPKTFYSLADIAVGSGGSQTASISGGGFATASCSSVFAGGGFQSVSGEVEVTPNSITARVAEPFASSPADASALGVEADVSVTISGLLSAYTRGPVRDGWLGVTSEAGGYSGGFWIAGYDLPGDYVSPGVLPVKLGIPFTIGDISLFGGLLLRPYLGGEEHESALRAQWELYEGPLATPVPVFFGAPPLDIPEPASALLCVAGLGICAVVRVRAQ